MRAIAKLLLGDEAARVLDQFTGNDGDGFGLPEQARRPGEWCGSTPGHGAVADVLRGAAGSRRGGRPFSADESLR